MRCEGINTLLPDYVGLVDPTRLQEYARATGWRQEPRLGRGQTAVFEWPESREQQFAIPIDRGLQDYELLMAQSIAAIARHEERAAAEILAELLLPSSDILRFGESSPAAAAGDVPFEHGLALLNGAKKTLLAAACSVIRPVSFHPRMSLADAEQFLQQCRLGQTERGSFVLTVACPLDAVPSEPNLFDGRPFTRQVTGLLMRSLHLLAIAANARNLDDVLRKDDVLHKSEDEPILSANLCEGLLEMAPEGHGSVLRVRAEFSRLLHSQLPDARPPTEVQLTTDVFQKIEYLAKRLRPVHVPQSQILVGHVETLNGRPNMENRPEGQVTLRVISPETDLLRARVELNADQYAVADKAHMENLPVSAKGILRQTGRTSFQIDQLSDFAIIQPKGSAS